MSENKDYQSFDSGGQAVAAATVTTTKVHIPPCQSKKCRSRLQELGKRFREKGIECIDKYKLHGTYKKQFEPHLKEARFTVLHTCPFLWWKIRNFSCIEPETELAEKLIVVSFGSLTLEEAAECGDSKIIDDEITSQGYKQFCGHFPVSDISEDEDLIDFVDEVAHALSYDLQLQCTLNTDAREEGACDNSSSGTDVPSHTTESEVTNTEGIKRYDGYEYGGDDFQSIQPETRDEPFSNVLDIFNETSQEFEVYARTEYLKVDLYIPQIPSGEYTENLRKDISGWKRHPDLQAVKIRQQHILQKELPQLFKSKTPLPIAFVAVCNVPELQERALTFLELLLLQGDLEGSNNKKQCEEAEKVLAKAVGNIRQSYPPNTLEKMYSDIRRIFIIMILLHIEVAKDCGHEKNSYEAFTTLIRSSLRHKAPKSNARVDRLFNKVDTLFLFLKSAESLTEDSCKSSLDKLKSPKLATQIMAIYGQLKEIFSDYRVKEASVLKELASQPALLKKLPKLCNALLFHGLALFLLHGLRSAGLRNIKDICMEVFDFFISDARRPDSCVPTEVILMLAPLLYNKTPVIHDKMKALLEVRGLYPEHRIRFLHEEIERLLCPLLHATSEPTAVNKWMTTLGQFCDKKVIVMFDECDEQDKSPLKYSDCKELMALQTLQHENIIKMFAYQMEHAPRFYITEGFKANSLQEALKYGNDNKKYIEISTLTRYLIIVSEALKYCHEAGILHRNLTAASLFKLDDTVVKLGGFQLSVKLHDKKEFEDPGHCEIPVRWSAYESLKWGKFNYASDVWMMGALMYEMLTHGAMPYSHTYITYKELPQMLKSSQPLTLNREACLRDDHYTLMCQCMSVNPKDRPTLSEIIRKLRATYQEMKAASTVPQPKYPPLQGSSQESRCPSTAYEDIYYIYGEVEPSNLNKIRHHEEITETLIKKKTADGYSFQEKVSPRMPVNLQNAVKSLCRFRIMPSITIMNLQDTTFIEYKVQAHDVMSIMEVVYKRKFGDSVEEYLKLLLQAAQIMEVVHNDDLVLGCIETRHLFLEQQGSIKRMHIMSFGYLNWATCSPATPTTRPSSVLDGVKQTIQVIWRRSAPEVTSDRHFTKASDVYSFGLVILSVLTGLVDKNPYTNREPPLEQLSKLKEQGDETIGRTANLIERCLEKDAAKRPTISEVITTLTSDTKDIDEAGHSCPPLDHKTTESESDNESVYEDFPLYSDSKDMDEAGYSCPPLDHKTTESESDDKSPYEAIGASVAETLSLQKKVPDDMTERVVPSDYDDLKSENYSLSGVYEDGGGVAQALAKDKKRLLPPLPVQLQPSPPLPPSSYQENEESTPSKPLSKSDTQPVKSTTQEGKIKVVYNNKLRQGKTDVIAPVELVQYSLQTDVKQNSLGANNRDLSDEQNCSKSYVSCDNSDSPKYQSIPDLPSVDHYQDAESLTIDHHRLSTMSLPEEPDSQPDSITQIKQLYKSSSMNQLNSNAEKTSPSQPASSSHVKQTYRDPRSQQDGSSDYNICSHDEMSLPEEPNSQPDSITQVKQLHKSSSVNQLDKMQPDDGPIYVSSKSKVIQETNVPSEAASRRANPGQHPRHVQPQYQQDLQSESSFPYRAPSSQFAEPFYDMQPLHTYVSYDPSSSIPQPQLPAPISYAHMAPERYLHPRYHQPNAYLVYNHHSGYPYPFHSGGVNIPRSYINPSTINPAPVHLAYDRHMRDTHPIDPIMGHPEYGIPHTTRGPPPPNSGHPEYGIPHTTRGPPPPNSDPY